MDDRNTDHERTSQSTFRSDDNHPVVVMIDQGQRITGCNTSLNGLPWLQVGDAFSAMVLDTYREEVQRSLDRAMTAQEKLHFFFSFHEQADELYLAEVFPTLPVESEEALIVLIKPVKSGLEKRMDEQVIWQDIGMLIRTMQTLSGQLVPFTLALLKANVSGETFENIPFEEREYLSSIMTRSILDYFQGNQQLYQVAEGTFALLIIGKQSNDRKWNAFIHYINKEIALQCDNQRITLYGGIVSGKDHPFSLLHHARQSLEQAERKGSLLHFHKERPPLFNLDRDTNNILVQQQINIYYEPIYDAMADAVVGMEASLYWDHPVFGMIPQEEFATELEEEGLMVKVGYDAFREICRHVKGWKSSGYDRVKIHLNVLASQLSMEWVEQLNRMMVHEQVNPECFVMEITETSLMKDRAYTDLVIERMRRLGCSVCVDKFGSGPTDLSVLDSLEVDALKVDPCFLEHLTDKKEQVLKSIISLSQDLGIHIMVEGVKEAGHQTMLMNQHCYDMQGAYFCKPMKHNEVQTYLEQF
ncbi:EAL domain-containing protein [Halobacillus salinus]|uniref:EAL domain-containing protein n=1 Tax=Halobacillus salinus TaxID=192814 RepID=A0A4Z0H2S1_9BACI|nr:EAL domain-containing protein [Halobacillus salinus]TGB03706.1 EAL domain-containing protein [Halobacillus salinus]